MSEHQINRIELPTIFGMETVNSFLIKGEENVLIDCGEDTDESFKALVEGVNSNGLHINEIDKIIVTHAHVDHIGMAGRVAAASDAKVWVNEWTHPWAVDPDSMWQQRENLMIPSLLEYFHPDMREIVRTTYTGFMKRMSDYWKAIPEEKVNVYPSSGQMSLAGTSYEILYLPGHTQTQTAFFNRENGDFISADMLLRITPTPVVEPLIDDPSKRNKGIIQMLDSYKRLLELPLGTIYPGHYDVFDNAHILIESQLKRIEHRKNECLSIIESGINSFFDMIQKLYKNRMHMPAFIMLIGYLDLLENEGAIELQMKDGYKQAFALK